MAGPGSDRCGVGVGHSFAELREVASEECPTGITELGVQPASALLCMAERLRAARRFACVRSIQTCGVTDLSRGATHTLRIKPTQSRSDASLPDTQPGPAGTPDSPRHRRDAPPHALNISHSHRHTPIPRPGAPDRTVTHSDLPRRRYATLPRISSLSAVPQRMVKSRALLCRDKRPYSITNLRFGSSHTHT